jgi:hypothetical protein
VKLALSLATLTLLSSAALATSDLTPGSYDQGSSIVVGGGPSIVLLGGWERRVAALVGYSTWKPEPKIEHKLGNHIQQVWTFYGMFHEGQDSRWDYTPTFSAGFTYGYRKAWADSSGRGFAYQLYWGFMIDDKTSHDLPSTVNSTPGMTFTWMRPLGAKNLNANLQWMHVSNGNTQQPNRGENFFLLTLDCLLH